MIVEGWYRFIGSSRHFDRLNVYYVKQHSMGDVIIAINNLGTRYGWTKKGFVEDWEYPNTLMGLLCE